MFKIFMTISIVLSTLFASAAKDQKAKAYNPNPLMVAEFMSNFKTIGEYIQALNERGLISQVEQEAITQILKEKNISLNDELIQPQAKNNKLIWGKNTLSYEDNGAFKTQDGVFIRFDKITSADQALSKTLNALSNQKTSLLKSLLLNEAYAQTTSPSVRGALEAVGSGLYAVGYHAIKGLVTILNAAGGTVINGAGFILEQATVRLANIIYKGSIECSEYGDYKLHLGYEFVNWKKEYKTIYDFRIYDAAVAGYSKTLAGYAGAGIEMFANGVSPKEHKKISWSNGPWDTQYEDTYISQEELDKIFPKGIPQCTKAYAAIVEKAVKAQAKKHEADLKEAKLKSVTQKKAAPAKSGKSHN